MTPFEKIREAAAKICDLESEECTAYSGKARAKACADQIRSMPLPAASPEPICLSKEIIGYQLGNWFEARTVDEMSAFYMSRLTAIREAARQLGYAIGLHGSTRRDFDLMAMQWAEKCGTPDELAHAIAMAACGITRDCGYQWEAKPQGRIATSFPICWTDHSENFDKNALSLGHIDLSIMLPDTEALRAEVNNLCNSLKFVERCANHHARNPNIAASEILSMIQHYPPIIDITKSYADGVIPETPSPYEVLATLRAENERLRYALSNLVDITDEPPESNCSCHIAPPCGDCVDYAQLREVLENAKSALKGGAE